MPNLPTRVNEQQVDLPGPAVTAEHLLASVQYEHGLHHGLLGFGLTACASIRSGLHLADDETVQFAQQLVPLAVERGRLSHGSTTHCEPYLFIAGSGDPIHWYQYRMCERHVRLHAKSRDQTVTRVNDQLLDAAAGAIGRDDSGLNL
jgi:hypothetical protein